MTDIRQMLDIAADVDRPAVDPGADLARGRTAQRARTRKRLRTGLSGLALAAVLGVSTTAVIAELTEDAPTSPGVHLVADEFEAAPYTFDLTPVGWSVQGQRPSAVTIAPDDGSTSDHPDDFVGKLVILFDTNPPGGKRLTYQGRSLWMDQSEDYVTLATLTRTGEPAGVVRIQYPRKAGWSRPAMEAFLASVHVGDTARHGMG